MSELQAAFAANAREANYHRLETLLASTAANLTATAQHYLEYTDQGEQASARLLARVLLVTAELRKGIGK